MNIYDKSILIVAHPDDDILWFSSILKKVEDILFCFSDSPTSDDIGFARKQTLLEYPLNNHSSLEFIEPNSFNKANWDNPISTKFGIELSESKIAETRYQQTYKKLESVLKNILKNKRNVFTHNPWGEYGHEEHILIYRVIKNLQPTYGYDIWYSNYCSNHSINMLFQNISGFTSDYLTLPCDIDLAKNIVKLYKKNDCWTWYDDYCWFEEECLIKASPTENSLNYGHIFPLNMLKIHIENASETKPQANVFYRGLRQAKNILNPFKEK